MSHGIPKQRFGLRLDRHCSEIAERDIAHGAMVQADEETEDNEAQTGHIEMLTNARAFKGKSIGPVSPALALHTGRRLEHRGDGSTGAERHGATQSPFATPRLVPPAPWVSATARRPVSPRSAGGESSLDPAFIASLWSVVSSGRLF